MNTNEIEKEIAQDSELWKQHRAYWNNLARENIGNEEEFARFIRDYYKIKILTPLQAFTDYVLNDMQKCIEDGNNIIARDPEYRYNLLLDIEHTLLDWIKISDVVEQSISLAQQAGGDSNQAGIDAFLWAMEIVQATGSAHKIDESHGIGKEQATNLVAGWVDSQIGLKGAEALRLQKALGATSDAEARKRLRELLPGAVLEIVQQWEVGVERFKADRRLPKAGKKTAGRGKRTFLSRVIRAIDRDAIKEVATENLPPQKSQLDMDEASMSNPETEYLKRQRQELALRQLAQAFGNLRLSKQQRQIANYILADADLIELGGKHGYRLKYGVQAEIARVLNCSEATIRQQTMRMFEKLRRLKDV